MTDTHKHDWTLGKYHDKNGKSQFCFICKHKNCYCWTIDKIKVYEKDKKIEPKEKELTPEEEWDKLSSAEKWQRRTDLFSNKGKY